MWKKKGEENIFSDSKWCLRFGYGAENKICSIKETRAYCFILFILFFLPSKLHTQRFFGFWETHKVPGSMISTEPPCTCLSYCFPCNTWRNVSHSKQGNRNNSPPPLFNPSLPHKGPQRCRSREGVDEPPITLKRKNSFLSLRQKLSLF